MAKGVFCVLVNRFLVCLLLISSVVRFPSKQAEIDLCLGGQAADIMLKVVACARILMYNTF